MADIFLSYTSKDRPVARELVRLFEREGWSTFWDRDVAGGAQYQPILEQELDKARCALVLWSPNSVKSTWVRGEAQRAVDRQILIPVELGKARPPLPFNSINGIPLGDWPASENALELKRLIASVRLMLEVPGVEHTIVRDDPTLSSRVAQRVISALDQSDAGRAAVALRLERCFNRVLADAVVGKRTSAEVCQRLIDGLAIELECDGAWLLAANVVLHSAGRRRQTSERLSNVLAEPHEPDKDGTWWYHAGTTLSGRSFIVATDSPLDQYVKHRLQQLGELLADLSQTAA